MEMKKIKKPRALSWKPKARGHIYCAPACGRGCTKAEHDEVKRKAEEICKQLGRGWKVRMNENLGWYAQAVCGDVQVEATRGFDDPGHQFHALVNIYKTPAHGPGGILYDVYAKTPRAALSALIKEAVDGESRAAQVHANRAIELRQVHTALITLVMKEVS